MPTNRPEGVTKKAQRECAEWLASCLGFGWKQEKLDALESIWWKFHDAKGELIKTLPRAAFKSPG